MSGGNLPVKKRKKGKIKHEEEKIKNMKTSQERPWKKEKGLSISIVP